MSTLVNRGLINLPDKAEPSSSRITRSESHRWRQCLHSKYAPYDAAPEAWLLKAPTAQKLPGPAGPTVIHGPANNGIVRLRILPTASDLICRYNHSQVA